MTDVGGIQQVELLREIREELRMSRAATATAAGGASRAPSTSVIGQAWTDRMLASRFDGMEWTNSYSHLYRGGFFSDMFGAAGFTRSPASMTQAQFEQVAAENIGLRAGSLVTGFIAPGYTHRMNSMADAIQANSYRFARYGESSAPFGIGFSRSGSLNLARQLNTMAMGDMRLRPEDYGTVVSTGVAAGQFDDIRGSTSEFISRVRELADAAASASRIMHTSVQETVQAMANLRMLGVMDTGAQQRTLLNANAAAMVAGVNVSEILGAGQAAAQAGLVMGIGAETSVGMAASNVALARALRPAGLISSQRMAAGGGAFGVAQSITQFEQGVLASDFGYLASMGRRGGVDGFLDAGIGGLRAFTSGGLEGMLAMQAERADFTSSISADEAQRLARESIVQQIRMMGVTDMRSSQARNLAYSFARGRGMDDASAIAYANANFTEEGLRISQRTKLREINARSYQSLQDDYDKFYAYESTMGRYRRGVASVSQSLSRAGERIGRAFDVGQTGFLGFDGRIDRTVYTMNAGYGVDPSALLYAGSGTSIRQGSGTFTLDGDSPGIGTYLAGAGLTLGALALAPVAMPFLAGAALGSTLGASATLAVGGTMLGVPQFGGEVFAGVAGSFGHTTQSQEFGRTYLAATRGAKEQVNATQVAGMMPGLRKSAAYRQLLNMDMSEATQAGTIRQIALLQKAAEESGVSVEQISATLSYAGQGTNFVAGRFSGDSGGSLDAFGAELKTLVKGTALEGQDVNLLSAQAATALAGYVGALGASGSVIDSEAATTYGAQLHQLGITDLVGLRRNVAAGGAGFRDRFRSAALGARGFLGDREMNRALSGALSFAESVVGGMAGDDRAAAAGREIDALRSKNDYRGLLEALNNDGSALGSVLRESGGIWQDAANIASAADLQKMSREDLARRFSLQKSEADQVFERIHGGQDGADAARAFLQVRALQQGEASEGTTEVRVATLLNQAATTLRQINATLNPSST